MQGISVNLEQIFRSPFFKLVNLEFPSDSKIMQTATPVRPISPSYKPMDLYLFMHEQQIFTYTVTNMLQKCSFISHALLHVNIQESGFSAQILSVTRKGELQPFHVLYSNEMSILSITIHRILFHISVIERRKQHLKSVHLGSAILNSRVYTQVSKMLYRKQCAYCAVGLMSLRVTFVSLGVIFINIFCSIPLQ